MGLHPWGGLRGSEPCKGLAHILAQRTHLTFVDGACAHTCVCVRTRTRARGCTILECEPGVCVMGMNTQSWGRPEAGPRDQEWE